MKKICTKCGIEKQISYFHKEKNGKYGVRSICKKCRKTDNAVNKNSIQAYNKEYYKNNGKKIRTASKKQRKNHPKEIQEYMQIYQKNNKKKLKKYINIYMKKRRKIDSKFRLNCNIRDGIGRSLRGAKAGQHWEDMVGYTIKQLKRHLEGQFIDGMTWDNYGEWHIDHIIPIAAHNFTKPFHTDFKRAWSLENLQPMWAEDNLKKHAKLTKHFQPSLLI